MLFLWVVETPNLAWKLSRVVATCDRIKSFDENWSCCESRGTNRLILLFVVFEIRLYKNGRLLDVRWPVQSPSSFSRISHILLTAPLSLCLTVTDCNTPDIWVKIHLHLHIKSQNPEMLENKHSTGGFILSLSVCVCVSVKLRPLWGTHLKISQLRTADAIGRRGGGDFSVSGWC